MHSTWQRHPPPRPHHPMADVTYAPQPQRFYGLSESAFDAQGEYYGAHYHQEEPAFEYPVQAALWSPEMKRQSLHHSHDHPMYHAHSPTVHTLHPPAPPRTIFNGHDMEVVYHSSSEWDHQPSPAIAHSNTHFSPNNHFTSHSALPRVKQEDIYTPIPSYPSSHHRSSSQQYHHIPPSSPNQGYDLVTPAVYTNHGQAYYSPPAQYIHPAELSPSSPHSAGCDPRFVSGESDGEDLEYPALTSSLPPLEHMDSDLDAEGEDDEGGEEDEEDQEDYADDVEQEDDDDGEYVLRRGRSAGSGEGRTTRLRSSKRYNPYAYDGTSSSDLYLSTSTNRPRRLTSSSNTSSNTSVSSPSSTTYNEGTRRRARPAVTLPVPIPVPNLTKKSRGRRVPTAVSSDRRQAADADFGDTPAGRRSAAKGVRMYTCKVSGCNKLFARGEHLKRHVRSIHTYEKPHKCPYPGCDKDFSRHDNLGQHMRVHKDYNPHKDNTYRN